MLSISSRVAAAQRSRLTAASLTSRSLIWPGATSSWNQTSIQLPHSQPHFIQNRNYIFLPSTIDDMMKLIKSESTERGRIVVKLSTRWHDQLGAVLDRYEKMLRHTSSTLLSNMKSSHVSQTPTSVSPTKTITKYKSLKSWGMSRLLNHYNAKKRVFARKRKTFRRMNSVEVKVFREQYYNQKKLSLYRGLNRLRTRVEKKREEVRDWLLNSSRNEAVENLTSSESLKPTNVLSGAKATWKSLILTEPSKQTWFDAEGYPLTSREETGRFVNPWLSQSTNGANGLKKFLRWKTEKLIKKLGLDVGQDESLSSSHAVDENNKKSIYRHGTQPYSATALFTDGAAAQTIKLAWLGHATTLVSLPGNFTILTDPHFSNYAGPMKRNDPPPVSVLELPEIDCVLISHDHMDHLDYWSILELIDSNKVKFWVVPLGIKEWLINKAGVTPEDIIELEWWEAVRFSKDMQRCDGTSPSLVNVEGLVRAFDKASDKPLNNKTTHTDRNEMVITCAPAQHWCSRTPFDRNRRLWCSYAVHSTPASINSTPRSHSFYFAGDTGLPPEFPLHHQIGDRLGPFDLAAIPIGAYEPRWFMKESHCNPAEAIEIHQAIRSRKSVAIHFDTFNLADEPQAEPPKLLMEEVEKVNEEVERLAAEVVAVADEVNVVVKETPGIAPSGISMNGDDEGLQGNLNEKDLLPHGSLKEASNLVEILPPLVDFAVIQQGHYIESSPKN